MREATAQEYQDALAKAGWPPPRHMATKRSFDVFYSDRGTEVASRHETLKRGKVIGVLYMVNPAYLPPRGELAEEMASFKTQA
jgi:hypothetical protein